MRDSMAPLPAGMTVVPAIRQCQGFDYIGGPDNKRVADHVRPDVSKPCFRARYRPGEDENVERNWLGGAMKGGVSFACVYSNILSFLQ